jgi:hypothetical protein
MKELKLKRTGSGSAGPVQKKFADHFGQARASQAWQASVVIRLRQARETFQQHDVGRLYFRANAGDTARL